jgi:hypothetical protein
LKKIGFLKAFANLIFFMLALKKREEHKNEPDSNKPHESLQEKKLKK